jgi:hypothetical protein
MPWKLDRGCCTPTTSRCRRARTNSRPHPRGATPPPCPPHHPHGTPVCPWPGQWVSGAPRGTPPPTPPSSTTRTLGMETAAGFCPCWPSAPCRPCKTLGCPPPPRRPPRTSWQRPAPLNGHTSPKATWPTCGPTQAAPPPPSAVTQPPAAPEVPVPCLRCVPWGPGCMPEHGAPASRP